MKRRSGNIRKNLPWFLGAAASVALLVSLIIVIWPEETTSTDLEVDEVYFSTKELGGTDTDLEILVFITNEGDDDVSRVEIRAFAVETDSNIARDEARVELSGLKAETSLEGKLYITVPNNDTYRIELLIFEEGKLSIRGSGTVDLTGVGSASDYRTDGGVDDEALYDTMGIEEDGAASGSILICMFMGVVVIGILVAVVVAVSKKKGSVGPEERMEPELKRRRLWEEDLEGDIERPSSRKRELKFEPARDQQHKEESNKKDEKEEN
ncbi:MAG: hypothetical protein KAH57_01015 [Thermoplasmata archaeon]|nr:hypothetical protein [Thermoplasmata archaeon]